MKNSITIFSILTFVCLSITLLGLFGYVGANIRIFALGFTYITYGRRWYGIIERETSREEVSHVQGLSLRYLHFQTLFLRGAGWFVVVLGILYLCLALLHDPIPYFMHSYELFVTLVGIFLGIFGADIIVRYYRDLPASALNGFRNIRYRMRSR